MRADSITVIFIIQYWKHWYIKEKKPLGDDRLICNFSNYEREACCMVM